MSARWLIPLALSVVLAAGLIWALADDPEPSGETTPAAEQVVAPARTRAPRPPDRGELVLTGAVLRPDGTPAAGAEVKLARDHASDALDEECPVCGRTLVRCPAPRSFHRAFDRLGAPEALTAEARTVADAQGAFRFEGLGGTSYAVWARAPGFGPAVRERAAPGEPVQLTLARPRTLSGTVVDEDGRGVGGARVLALSRVPELAEVRTSADGAFTFATIGDGPFYVVAGADGFIPDGKLQAEASGEPLRLQLQLSRTLDVVVQRDGRPVEARVDVEAEHDTRIVEAKEGSARFEALAGGEVTVFASAGGRASPAKQVKLVDRFTTVVLELGEGAAVAVTVMDDAERPVPNPRLSLELGQSVLLRRTGGSGERIVLGPVAPGAYTLRVEAEGFHGTELPVEIRGGERELEVLLRQAARISGRVLDEYGRPAAGVSVTADPVGESAPSDADGRFSMTVPNAGLYRLAAHHSDWGGAHAEVTAPIDGVELALQPRASAELTVVADGKPVEGADVHLQNAEVAFGSDRPSGGDGVALMRGIPPGKYTAFATHPLYFSERSSVTLEDGQTARATLALKSGASIRGTVRDERGGPIVGAFVFARASVAQPATTGPDGAFELRPLRPATNYRLEARHPEYELSEPVAAAAGATDARLTLKRKQRFSGRVVDLNGAPLTRFTVDKQEFFADDGRFEVSLAVADDHVTFVVDAPGFVPEVVKRPARPDLGAVRLERAPVLTGKVVDTGGGAVAHAEVGCDACDGTVLTEADGSFRLPHFPTGRELKVAARKGTLSGNATGQAGRELRIVLRPWAQVRLGVFTAEGKPASGVRVGILSLDGLSASPELVTAADGSLTTELSPGMYRFSLSPYAPHLVANIPEGGRDLVLGAAPGTASLNVRVKGQRGYALWIVPGTLTAVEDTASTLHRRDLVRVHYYPQNVARFEGLTPGQYTVVWANQYGDTPGGPRLVPVTVNGVTEVDLTATR